jgi:hypothetical protein
LLLSFLQFIAELTSDASHAAVKLVATGAFGAQFLVLVHSAGYSTETFLCLWPYLAALQQLLKASLAQPGSRVALIGDVVYAYSLSLALFHRLVVGRGAVVVLGAELCFSVLAFLVSLTRLLNSLLFALRIERAFPRLSSAALAGLASDEVCSVCLEHHTSSSCQLRCRHIVHSDCLVSVLQSRLNSGTALCPVCRAAIFSEASAVPRQDRQRERERERQRERRRTDARPHNIVRPTHTVSGEGRQRTTGAPPWDSLQARGWRGAMERTEQSTSADQPIATHVPLSGVRPASSTQATATAPLSVPVERDVDKGMRSGGKKRRAPPITEGSRKSRRLAATQQSSR